MMLRLLAALLCLAPVPIHAQPSVLSSATLGWTSNAEGAAGGSSDTFVGHSHSLSLTHRADGLALRGALSFSETRYARLWQENDRQIDASLAGEVHLTESTLARATLALGYHEEGQAIALAPILVGATTPFLKGSVGFEIESRIGATLITAGINYGALAHGETAFSLPITPLRTRADASTWSGDLRLAHALSETFAVTGLVRGLIQSIPDADQVLYGRVPARVVSLAVGIEAQLPLRAAFALEAGGDIVWAELASIDTQILPYARSEITLSLGGGFDFQARLRTSLDFDTPTDGYGDWIIEGRSAIGYAISQTMRLEAAVMASATRSIGFDVEHKRQIGGEVSAEAAFNEHFKARASIKQSRHSGLAPTFDETRLGLTLTATL